MTIRVKQLEWLERRRFLEADGYQVCCNGNPHDPDAMYRVKFHGKVICKKIKGVDRAMQWAQTHHERHILSAIEEDRDEVLEQAARVAEDAAWKHLGTDCYSQGMDAGARRQVKECAAAIRAMKGGEK